MPVGVSAYVPLATKTLTATATSVTFSSISQAYRDLVLVGQTGSSVAGNTYVRFNGDTGANYNLVYMVGDGSTASSSASVNSSFASLVAFDLANNLNTNFSLNIMDYSATDKHKSGICRSNLASAAVDGRAIRWANTSAITSVVISPWAGAFLVGSTFTLYGIAA